MRRLIALWLLLFGSSSLHAQDSNTLGGADSLYFAGRVADALVRYESLLAARPNDFEVLCHAVRAEITTGVLSDRGDVQESSYRSAEEFARRAIAVDSMRADGHYWLAASLGRQALRSELKKAARLAKATNAEALRALAIDSTHAGAHAVLGKLNSEVRNLSAFVRFVAGRLLGVSIARETSWEAAEMHLKRAIQMDSTSILYRTYLAQLYQRMGRRAEAEGVVNQLLAMPRIQPDDAHFQQEARDRLR